MTIIFSSPPSTTSMSTYQMPVHQSQIRYSMIQSFAPFVMCSVLSMAVTSIWHLQQLGQPFTAIGKASYHRTACLSAISLRNFVTCSLDGRDQQPMHGFMRMHVRRVWMYLQESISWPMQAFRCVWSFWFHFVMYTITLQSGGVHVSGISIKFTQFIVLVMIGCILPLAGQRPKRSCLIFVTQPCEMWLKGYLEFWSAVFESYYWHQNIIWIFKAGFLQHYALFTTLSELRIQIMKHIQELEIGMDNVQ